MTAQRNRSRRDKLIKRQSNQARIALGAARLRINLYLKIELVFLNCLSYFVI